MSSWRQRIAAAVDPDRALQVSMRGLIEAAAARHALGRSPVRWRRGEPLRLYLAGYVGARNTGADVRVEEMIRQLRHLIGDERLQLTLPAFDRTRCAGYFRAVRQDTLPVVFPRYLFSEVPKHHGVVACEGSMFKSKFSDALSTMMAGALGLANAEGKLSVGYGAEAGEMSEPLERFVATSCRESLILCRNQKSRVRLEALGIRARGGADTAWTFEPAPSERGAQILREAGWDGKTPVLGVAPIHPFWWPVKPDVFKAFGRALGGNAPSAPEAAQHYKSVYFHHRSEESERAYRRYLAGIAEGVRAAIGKRPMFVVLIGMEALDRKPCEDLNALLPFDAPRLVSDRLDMYDLVAVLRQLSALLSSRFHAIVCSSPAAVPAAGITMDERIDNLLTDRGDGELCMWVDDDDLGERVAQAIERLVTERSAIAHRIARDLPRQLEAMGTMGIDFLDELERMLPDFERIPRPRTWEAHLPPLPLGVERMLEAS